MKYINETMVVVGLSLLAYGFNAPWTSYDESEKKRIEAVVQVESFAFTYGEYARRVNSQIDLYNSCVKQGDDCDKEQMKEAVMSKEADSREWAVHTHEVAMESKKAAHLAIHYEKMKYIWLGVGVFSCLLGAGLLFYGLVAIRNDKQLTKQSSGAQAKSACAGPH